MPDLEHFNDQQREAILCENKRVLVLAGAGSGKTKTLIQKLLYLIQYKQVKPSNILAITFTKNATNEMIDRLILAGDATGKYEVFINTKHISRKEKDAERFKQVQSKPWINNLTIRTFHSLCYHILKNYGGSVYDNKFRLILEDDIFKSAGDFKGRAPEKPFELLHKILIEKCKDKNYLLTLKRYILDFYVDKIFMEDKLRATAYKTETKYTTLKGEKVRSKSERDIADWLYRHSIKYIYEPEICFKDFEFRPDFFVPQVDLYIEHVSNKSFPMNDKEQQFTVSGHTLVKTYESMTQNSNLFNLALERIVMGKINGNISQIVSLSFEEEFKSYHDKIEEFLRMCMRVLSMAKADNIDFKIISQKANQSKHDRVKIFYELCLPLLTEYKNYCVQKSYLDFDDLLIETINLLENHAEIRTLFQQKFKYILVDEFQDVNSLQVKLLKLLATEDNQLFCVGDDWQSIYGFRGSEVDYIINFEKHFELSVIITLGINYRSNESIVNASNEVIKNNKFKIEKEIKAIRQSPNKLHIFKAKAINEDGVNYVTERISEYLESGLNSDEILILYRRSKMFSPYWNALRQKRLNVAAKTIHAAKGLEARIVFILGLTDGSGGFPDIWLDDIVFRTIKDVKYDLLMEEERRLFYVAITRAKEELHLVTELGNESRFIDEIPNHFFNYNSISFQSVVEPLQLCASCKTAVQSNYKFCPSCGSKLIDKVMA